MIYASILGPSPSMIPLWGAYGEKRSPAQRQQVKEVIQAVKRNRKGCPRQPSPITRRVEEVLELPEGALSGAARVELSGNRRAVVEGCRGILEYEEGVIRLNTTSGIVRFMGRDLTMNCPTEDSAVVTGFILSVEFLS